MSSQEIPVSVSLPLSLVRKSGERAWRSVGEPAGWYRKPRERMMGDKIGGEV